MWSLQKMSDESCKTEVNQVSYKIVVYERHREELNSNIGKGDGKENVFP